MGFRPVSQRLRDINLQALGKFSCLALVLGLESVSHPAGPVQAPSFSQGTASRPSPLRSASTARPAPGPRCGTSACPAPSACDELRWCFERDESEIARKNLKKYGKSHSRQIARDFQPLSRPRSKWIAPTQDVNAPAGRGTRPLEPQSSVTDDRPRHRANPQGWLRHTDVSSPLPCSNHPSRYPDASIRVPPWI